jgi:hypothetical protein
MIGCWKEFMFMVLARWAMLPAVAVALHWTAPKSSAQSLDFETYRTKVEPIFAKSRPGHARCVSCHSASNNAFHLQPLARGVSAWTEEQSRLNFESVVKLVNLKDPAASVLLKHPLAEDAGGDIFHSGGRQFTSQDDPDWKTIAAWVRGAK